MEQINKVVYDRGFRDGVNSILTEFYSKMKALNDREQDVVLSLLGKNLSVIQPNKQIPDEVKKMLLFFSNNDESQKRDDKNGSKKMEEA